MTLMTCDSGMGPTILQAHVEADVVADQARDRRAQLVAGLRGPPRAVAGGVEVPRRRDRGHPDLARCAVAVDDDPRAVAQIEPQHAVTGRHLDLVGIDVGERIFEVTQLVARGVIEARLVHARTYSAFLGTMTGMASDSDVDLGEPVEREGHETLLPSVTRSVLSTKSLHSVDAEADGTPKLA